jgi:hypothetical protein
MKSQLNGMITGPQEVKMVRAVLRRNRGAAHGRQCDAEVSMQTTTAITTLVIMVWPSGKADRRSYSRKYSNPAVNIDLMRPM